MKAIIVGASSGIGLEVAKLLLADGWHIGIAARREEALLELKKTALERVEVMAIDITHPDAGERLLTLVALDRRARNRTLRRLDANR